MAATFGDLKNEVYSNVYGYARDQEQATHLTAGIDADDTSVPVADTTQVNRGIIEIDDELMWVTSVNASGASATVAPWGRAHLGTTAAVHAINSRVTSNPRFPRASIARAINQTIQSVYPQLFGVAQTTFSWNSSQTTYDLPATADRVLSVRWLIPGPSGDWEKVMRWREILNVTGVNQLTISTPSIVPGQDVRVVYATKPTELSLDADLLTASGLAESCRDLVVYGALARLLMFAESGRLQSRAMESSELNEDVPAGSSMTTGRRLQEMYQLRLAEERKRLLERYPPSVHLMRW